MTQSFSFRGTRRRAVRAMLSRLGIVTNWPVFVAVAVLSIAGLLTIWAYDNSIAESRKIAAERVEGATATPTPSTAKQQLKYLAVAIVCLVAFQAVNYQHLARFAWPFYFASFLPLVYTVVGSVIKVPGVEETNGAHNWIRFGSVGFQPAEVMKIAFVMVLAAYLRFRENHRTLLGLLAPFALCLVPTVLILKQPDLGTALVFIPTLLCMLFVAGARLWHILAIILLGVMCMPVIWLAGTPHTPVLKHLPQLVRPYQRDRVYALFDSTDPTLRDTQLQQRQSLTALGSGGFAGKGLGNLTVGPSVPEGQNDMIFALIGEQFGFIGTSVAVLAYVVLIIAGIEIAAAQKEPFGKLAAVGIVALVASQAFLNIAVALRLMPVTGVTLPFVSSGGSSLVSSYMAIGLLLNIGQNRPIVLARQSFEFDD